MKTLAALLERYTHIQAPEATLKKAFIKAVDEVVEVVLDTSDIHISKTTAFVKAPSVVKTEIKLNQQEILKKVAQEVNNNTALTAIV